MREAGGPDQGYQELRKVKDITDSPAFFDGKHARAIDAISAPAPHAMVDLQGEYVFTCIHSGPEYMY